ncbi:TonB-dependent receptor [Novosphingobium sp. B 225]|uniref:TonB-dependent receptor n=1 Tax=Novosphingobium sp. B 225 TaxID=1961849 RepID=UPI0020CD75B4|nr:TonB-dependent receptor [Novosphingobium sp. B 225]
MTSLDAKGAGSLRLRLMLGIALAAFAAPTAGFAQEIAEQPIEEEAEAAPPADEGATPAEEYGNEIVVTATKREQTLQNVPVAVSVATADAIERAAVRDLKDLQTLVPALRVTQLQSSANTNFIIRGFGNGANNAGIEPSVGVFVDGVYRSRTGAQIGDLPDVARVEVLRGPQSTLFGKNASAGVISLVTKEPAFKFHGSVEASYGNHDAKVLKGYVTGPVMENIAASLSAGINQRDGMVQDQGYGGRTNERNRWFLRGQLRIEPSSQLKLRLIADYDKIDEACCAVVNLRRSAATSAVEALGGKVNAASDPFGGVVYSNFASSNEIENWGISGQADYTVGPLKLTSITAYRKSKSRTNQDSDFTSADLIGQNAGTLDIGTFTQELRASAGFMDFFNAMAGAYFFDEKVTSGNALTYGKAFRPYANLLSGGGVGALESLVVPLAPGTFFAPGQGLFDSFQMHDKAWSVFGNLDFKPLHNVTLTIGANYTHDAKDVTSAVTSTDVFSGLNLVALGGGSTNPSLNPLLALRPLQFLPPFRNFPNAVESGQTRDGDWSWTGRLAWQVTDSVNTYFSYATGYKASSFNLSRDSRPLASDYAALAGAGLLVNNLTTGSRFAGPEDARVLELGIKTKFGIASANLTFFKQTIAGFQSNTFTGTGFALANAGKQSTRGVEFDGTMKAGSKLNLNLSLVYLDPRYESFVQSALGNATGTRPAGIPALSSTIGASWNHAFADGSRVIVSGDWHYESPVAIVEGLPGFIQRNALGQVVSYQPAFDAARPFKREVSEVNASLTYAMASGLELSVWGRNLTNDRYLLSLFDSVAQPGSISGYPNQPRTWGGSVRFKW